MWGLMARDFELQLCREEVQRSDVCLCVLNMKAPPACNSIVAHEWGVLQTFS